MDREAPCADAETQDEYEDYTSRVALALVNRVLLVEEIPVVAFRLEDIPDVASYVGEGVRTGNLLGEAALPGEAHLGGHRCQWSDLNLEERSEMPLRHR